MTSVFRQVCLAAVIPARAEWFFDADAGVFYGGSDHRNGVAAVCFRYRYRRRWG